MKKENLAAVIIHAAYGQAVLSSHSLEKNLFVLISTKLAEKYHGDESLFEKKQAQIKRMTLGNLIKKANKEFNFSSYWVEELDNVLFFRNRLVHEISEIITDHMWSHGDKEKIVNELNQISSYFKAADKFILDLIFDWFKDKGCPKEAIYEVARKMIKDKKT